MKPPAVHKSPASNLWFHECDRCPHIAAAWTRSEAETDQDRHAEVCPGRKGLLP